MEARDHHDLAKCTNRGSTSWHGGASVRRRPAQGRESVTINTTHFLFMFSCFYFYFLLLSHYYCRETQRKAINLCSPLVIAGFYFLLMLSHTKHITQMKRLRGDIHRSCFTAWVLVSLKLELMRNKKIKENGKPLNLVKYACSSRITAADGNKHVLIMESSTTVRLALASTLIIFKTKQN